MRKIVNLSVLSAVLLASLVGCTSVSNEKPEDGIAPLDSDTLQIKTLYGDNGSQKIKNISLLCVEGYAFLRTHQGGGYEENSSDARFPEKDAECEGTKPANRESGEK